MPYDATPEDRPAIPAELSKGLSPVEFELYYIAMKDRSETARLQNRKPVGVSFGGMGDFSTPYEPKTYDQMLAEARANVAKRAA